MMISENVTNYRFKSRGVVELHTGTAIMFTADGYHGNIVLMRFADELVYNFLVLYCFIMNDYCVRDIIVYQLKNRLFALFVY